MRHTNLGSSGIAVSVIGFGAMSLSGNQSHDVSLIHQAIDLGINLIDTADLYQQGENERIIGKAIKDRRGEIVLASKGGNQVDPNGQGWKWNPDPVYLRSALEASLQRLGTDYLDLYQLHGGTVEDPADEVIRFFEEEKKRGRIRAYGISSIRPAVIEYWVKNATMDTLMVQYSGLDRRPEEQIFPMLTEKKVTVLARGTVAKGMLAGKPAREYLGMPASAITDIVEMALPQQIDCSRAARAVQYVLGHEVVGVAVVGASEEIQLIETVEAGKDGRLSVAEKERLDRIYPLLKYEKHRLKN